MSEELRATVYSDPRWRRLRAEVLARAHYRCQRCSVRAKRLDVDHVIPIVDAPELAFARSNLVALCQGCHRVADARRQADKQRGYSLDAGADGWPVDPRHPSMRK